MYVIPVILVNVDAIVKVLVMKEDMCCPYLNNK